MWQLLYNRKVIDLTVQLLMLIVIVSIVFYFAINAAENMGAAGITTGFEFLFDKAGYDISYSLIDYDPRTDSNLDAWLVGSVNTVVFAILAIILTTAMSLLLALMRLSSNWLLSGLAYTLVEYVRNIPILIHIFVWYAAALTLPSVKQAISFGEVVFLSNRGLMLPSLEWNYLAWESVSLVAMLCLGGWLVRVKLSSKIWRLAAYFMVLVAAFASIEMISITGAVIVYPELRGFNFQGGMVLPPEFLTLLIAVSTYSAAHGSEVVRGSILAVSKGQTEAAQAMGASTHLIMRKVIIPQALRSIIPPMTSVYINVTKAAALGSVIGFMDIMGTIGGSSLNITGQAIECIMIVMVSYTVLNLCLAFLMGRLNRNVQLKER